LEEYTVIRDCTKNLRFDGEIIAVVRSRFHKLTLYLTESGKFVLSMKTVVKFPDRPPQYVATVCDDANHVFAAAMKDAEYDGLSYLYKTLIQIAAEKDSAFIDIEVLYLD